MSRTKKRLLAACAVTLLVTLLATLWLTTTASGARWLTARLGARLPGQLKLGEVSGSLLGGLRYEALRYRQGDLLLTAGTLELAARLGQPIRITQLWAEDVEVQLPATEQAQDDPAPITLPDPISPLALYLEDGRLRRLRITAAGSEPVEIDEIRLRVKAGRGVDIETLEVDLPNASAHLAGGLDAETIDLVTRWRALTAPGTQWSGEGTWRGSPQLLEARHRLLTPVTVEVEARVEAPLDTQRFQATLRLPEAALEALGAPLDWTLANVFIEAKGTPEAFELTSQLEMAAGGLGDWQGQLEARRDGLLWQLSGLELHQDSGDRHLSMTGRADLSGATPSFDLSAAWKELLWPRTDGTVLASPEGQLRLQGPLDDYALTAEATFAAGGRAAGAWTLDAQGSASSLTLENLAGTFPAGRFEAAGKVAWTGDPTWELDLSGRGVDPGALLSGWPGRLRFAGTSAGRLGTTGPEGSLRVSHLDGRLRGHPVSGSAALERRGERLLVDSLDLQWGSAQLSAAGSVDETWDLTWSLQAPDLAPLVPNAAGALASRGTLRGARARPRLEGSAQGSHLAYGPHRLDHLELTADADLATAGALDIGLDLGGLTIPGLRAQRIEMTVDGSLEAHRATALASGLELPRFGGGRLELELDGAWGEAGWQGLLQRLDGEVENLGAWSLASPASLEAISDGGFHLSDFCWRSPPAELCADGDRSTDGTWHLTAIGKALPLAALEPLLPPDLRIDAPLDFDLTGHGRTDGPCWAGTLMPRSGTLTLITPDGSPSVFELDGGELTVSLQEATARLRGEIGLAGEDRLRVDLGTRARDDSGPLVAGAGLQGELAFDVTRLDLLAPFLPQIENPAGEATADLRLAGTVGVPEVTGTAELRGGSLELPELGIRLVQIQLLARSNADGSAALEGSAAAGEGQIALDGKIDWRRRSGQARLTGESLQAVDLPELALAVSPDLELSWEDRHIRLEGEVAVPRARIDLDRRIPTVGVSPDAVLTSAAEPPPPPLAIDSRVRLTLGEDVSFKGYGLELAAGGELEIVDRSGQPTRATGEVELLDGTYLAYGQKLKIQEGRLLFPGGPLSAPGLQLTATRLTHDGVTAKLRASGPLARPQIEVFTDPATSPSDALSYLVIGRPLEGSTPDDNQALAAAVNTLSGPGSRLLQKTLGNRLGIDDIQIESGARAYDAALFLGKYLSPRLYVAYGVGIFRSVQIFRARYQLSRSWMLRTESGAETAVDLLYQPDP